MALITILHTNDLHARFEQMTRLATLIQRERAQAHQAGGTLLLLDAGDSSSGKVWESDLTQGRANHLLLEAMGYDATVIGNSDSRWGAAALARLLTSLHFPVLAANLRAANIQTKGSHILKAPQVSIGLIGLTTPINAHADFQFDDPIATVQNLIQQLKNDGAQIVIVLSHLGIEFDRQLAASVPGIQLIVGGHTHTTLAQPEYVGPTAIVQTGEFGNNLGRVDLEIDPNSASITRLRGQLIPVTPQIPPDPTVSGMLELIQFEAETLKKRQASQGSSR